MFEDIPVDFRYYKQRKKPRVNFPEEWIEIAKKKEAERLERKRASEVTLSA